MEGQAPWSRTFAGIRVQAVVDTNLQFWQAAFGFLGTLNDLNFW